ncbi:MAG: M6 family metalloprotease domain-containing protein [Bacteroidales bacterium]
MKKLQLTLLGILLFFAAGLQAAWLEDVPQTVTQPDGTVIHCFATGDEFYNWLHDASDFTIIQNPQTGYFTYAVLENGVLKASDRIVGRDDPAAAGLAPGINISAEKMKQRRQEFMQKHMPPAPALTGYNAPRSGRNEGTLNNLVVYVRFSDQAEFTADTTEYYDMFNDTTHNTSSMLNYFDFASYGQLNLPSHFYPIPSSNTVISYQDIYPRAYYMPYDPTTNPEGYQESQRTAREHKLLKRAIEYIEEEVPDNIDIDYNGDGYVDNVVFIVKGGTTAWSSLLWPHRWVLYSETAYINGKRVYDYNFQLETSLSSSGVGVLCHEMFHSLGAPDLYHYNSHPVTPVGDWDVMAANHNPPQLMSSFMKFRYGGWIENIPEITECGVYTLNPLASDINNCFKIASPNSTTDYFVIEYRLKEGVFESTLPSSGLLVYKVNMLEDGNGNAQGPPDELYIYRPGGSLSINGNLGQAAFAEDFGRTEFNDNTDPSCFLSNGQPGGIDIANVGTIGETISFEVNFEKEPTADFSASNSLVTLNCAVDFTDLSLCYVDEWAWEFEGATPATSTEQNPEGIVWDAEGVYDVTLTVTNQWGSNTIVYEDMITVSASALPLVEFTASDTLLCTGQVISLFDESEVCPTEWQWDISPDTYEFVNGTTAQDQNPEVQFNESGYYTIELTVTNDNGSVQLTKLDYIFAGGIPVNDYQESFEEGSFSAGGWTVVNPDNDVTWDIWEVNGSGAGTHAAVMNFFDYYSFNQRDQLISPPFDLTTIDNAILSFKHAYSRINNQYTDSLIVKISDDCGESWTRLMAIADDGTGNFVTAEPIGFSFVPQLPTEWCGDGFGAECYSLDLTPWTGMQNVKIMFETVCVIGNNLFIDDIKIDVVESAGESISQNNRVTIFPNPSSGIFSVKTIKPLEHASVRVMNISGQTILQQEVKNNGNAFTLNLNGYPKGIYMISIKGREFSETHKLIID